MDLLPVLFVFLVIAFPLMGFFAFELRGYLSQIVVYIVASLFDLGLIRYLLAFMIVSTLFMVTCTLWSLSERPRIEHRSE